MHCVDRAHIQRVNEIKTNKADERKNSKSGALQTTPIDYNMHGVDRGHIQRVSEIKNK